MVKWVVTYRFVKDSLQPITFIIGEFDNVLNVMRTIKFEDEVFGIEIHQRRDP